MPNRRNQPRPSDAPEGDIFTTVDDEAYDDLARLIGQRVVHAAVWEDSIADALESPDAETDPDTNAAGEDALADVDIYLKDGAYFELFGVAAFEALDQEQLPSGEMLHNWLTQRVANGLWLTDVAVDEEDALVLVLGDKRKPQLYLAIGAWTLGEWEELPEP
jgi:hypothetical protein